MELLEGVLRGAAEGYDWGSPTAIPELLGRVPTGDPVAELWLGAHPRGPARVGRDRRPLDSVIAADPVAALGEEVASRFGGLPFLLKVLAAARPLSLQVHPSAAQAAAGFAREEAAGVAVDAPERTFRDPHHKPELICALQPFEVLCGFREPALTLRVLDGLAAPALDPVREVLRADPDARGLHGALAWLLTRSTAEAADLVGATVAACRTADDPAVASTCAVAVELAARYPDDAGVVTALLMNHLVLEPGEALFLGAGSLHAYVRGVGVELMANSDNVVRGGLTGKHVDVGVLLDIVDTSPFAPAVLRPGAVDGVTTYPVPVPEFELQRIDVDGSTTLASGPSILICTDGSLRAGPHRVEKGTALWVDAADGAVALAGSGTVFRASPGHG